MQKIKKILAMTMAVIMLLSMTPWEVKAADKIKLNKTSTNIYVGNSITLKLTGTNKKVKWRSSNHSIVRVSSKGKITGKKAGKAVITAIIEEKKYNCKVTVKNPYLNVTKKTVTQGKTFSLTIRGSKALKWISSDESVATVSSKGRVKAKANGTAIISCICKNKKIYKCKVIVKEKNNNSKNNDKNDNKNNDNNGDENSNIADNGHLHKYKMVRLIKEATDTSWGEIEYVCKVEGCGKTIIMPYGKEMQFEFKDPNTQVVTKTATRYGCWDIESAKNILEGINEYRREKGFSDLQYLDKYEPYMKEHVMSCYFQNMNFTITPDDKRVRYICEGPYSDCHDSTYFKTKPGLLLPGNDGKNNAALFERDDIEVGVGCFAYTAYNRPPENEAQQCYSEEFWLPVTYYDIVICIFEDLPQQYNE